MCRTSYRLLSNLGLRYDDIYGSESAFSLRLGIIAMPRVDTVIKLLYGRAFRAPNYWELYYALASSGQKAPLNLDAEKIQTYELALEQRLSPQLLAVASLYHYTIKGLITQVTDPADGFLVFQNTDTINTDGIDFEMQGKWSWIEGRVSVAYQQAKNQQTGLTLSNSPKNLVKLNLIAPLWRERLSLGLETQYVSRRTGESSSGNAADVAGYALANLTLLHKNESEGVEVSAGVRNLFDRHYSAPTSLDDLPQIQAIPQDGRTYWIKLAYRF